LGVNGRGLRDIREAIVATVRHGGEVVNRGLPLHASEQVRDLSVGYALVVPKHQHDPLPARQF